MEFKTASGPGWGLTFDGNHLIASDGSATLVFWEVPGVSDRATREFRRINVRKDDGSSQDQVNELEYADGFIYANIWCEIAM